MLLMATPIIAGLQPCVSGRLLTLLYAIGVRFDHNGQIVSYEL